MNKIKEYILKENMTYKKLIIFSIVCGIITGIIPLLKFLDNTSVHNIAECYEMWVLLGLFIILKSKTPLESGLKVFLFFLISQPLCYLVQVPFYYDGFGIFKFYKFWFILTILTFPAGIFSYYLKKENIFSILILLGINALLSLELYTHFNELITNFPFKLLSVIFIILEIVLFIYIIFKDKKKRIIMYILSLFLIILTSVLLNIKNNQNINETEIFSIMELDSNTYEVIEQDDNIKVSIENNMITVKGKTEGTYTIVLKDQNGTELQLIYKVENDSSALELEKEN